MHDVIYILHALQVDYSCINRGNSAGFFVSCMIYVYVLKCIEKLLPHTERKERKIKTILLFFTKEQKYKNSH